jgi:hypothetical protein
VPAPHRAREASIGIRALRMKFPPQCHSPPGADSDAADMNRR